jgi:hypothetical protein
VEVPLHLSLPRFPFLPTIFLRFGRVPREDFVVRAESWFMEGEPRGTVMISSAEGESRGGAVRSALSSEPRGGAVSAATANERRSRATRFPVECESAGEVEPRVRLVCSESKIPDGVVFIQYAR